MHNLQSMCYSTEHDTITLSIGILTTWRTTWRLTCLMYFHTYYSYWTLSTQSTYIKMHGIIRCYWRLSTNLFRLQTLKWPELKARHLSFGDIKLWSSSVYTDNMLILYWSFVLLGRHIICIVLATKALKQEIRRFKA